MIGGFDVDSISAGSEVRRLLDKKNEKHTFPWMVRIVGQCGGKYLPLTSRPDLHPCVPRPPRAAVWGQPHLPEAGGLRLPLRRGLKTARPGTSLQCHCTLMTKLENSSNTQVYLIIS